MNNTQKLPSRQPTVKQALEILGQAIFDGGAKGDGSLISMLAVLVNDPLHQGVVNAISLSIRPRAVEQRTTATVYQFPANGLKTIATKGVAA